jgi:predicted RNase H-like HicB family nuclease
VIDLKYSLVIEATEDPTFFGFYSPDLEGFTGVGHSIEDCLYQAKWGVEEHIGQLREKGLPIPKENPNPEVTI